MWSDRFDIGFVFVDMFVCLFFVGFRFINSFEFLFFVDGWRNEFLKNI